MNNYEKTYKKKLLNSQSDNDLRDYCLVNNIFINDILPVDDYIEQGYPFGRYIINLSHNIKQTGGTHWVSIIHFLENNIIEKITENNLFYFDPFGTKPSGTFTHYSDDINLFNSNTQFQKYNDKICGFISAAFLSLTQVENLTVNKIDQAVEELKNYKFVD